MIEQAKIPDKPMTANEYGHPHDSQKAAMPLKKASEPKPNPKPYSIHSYHLQEIWLFWLFETNPRPKVVFGGLRPHRRSLFLAIAWIAWIVLLCTDQFL
ncbi:MAG: hypothetical protein GY841_22885 [FCB group bacterium]|nr:hypothetical protein [FCB group bacterium]